MNKLGMHRIPFFFLIDFEMKMPLVYSLKELPENLHFEFEKHHSTATIIRSSDRPLAFNKKPITLDQYKIGFDFVKKNLAYGNSFLTNYTAATPIELNYSLTELFPLLKAKYKLLVENQVLVFSPESFVKIEKGWIKSFPMKGTIDADLPNAESTILGDEKELAEHYTIVDLIRNDLSRVSKNVHVPRFRFIDEIQSNQKRLLQVSSEVMGKLPANHLNQLGTIFSKLLPAGSISGAPKQKTCEIIRKAEGSDRGYYTGVFGIFDGENVDSGVAIRFIEQKENNFYYKSGGGITYKSDLKSEYHEMIDKVYVPINRNHQDLQREGVQYKTPQSTVQ